MPVTTEKTIHIQYYAMLRELRGQSSETFETAATTPRELYEILRIRHTFPLEQSQLKVAVNDAFASWETPLNTGDSVVFIPPVAGG